MANEIPSFAELIEKAQATPPGKRLDVANPLQGRMANGDPVVNLDNMKSARIPGNSEYDFEAHVEFLCFPGGDGEGEKGGEKAYERILNMALKGEAIIRSEDKTFDKNGDFLVVIQYLTYKPKPKKRRSEGEDRDRHD